MSDLLEKAEAFAAKPGRLSRRTLVGRLAKVSAGLAFGAAGSTAGVAIAASGGNYQCCNLFYPGTFCNSEYKCTNKCPSGCGESVTWVCQDDLHCRWVCGNCYGCDCSFAYKVCETRCPC
jgi:hypothetical protein